MKSEIIYDGGVLEKRDRMLQNLATIIISETLQYNIRANTKALEDKAILKERALKEDLRSHFYFDIKVGSVVYPLLAVGDYGLAYMGGITDEIFNGVKRTYSIIKLEEINTLKCPWFTHLGKEFEKIVLDNQETPTLGDVIDRKSVV